LRDKWLSGDDDAKRKVAEVMERAGLSITDLQARAIGEKIDIIERIDRMTAQAEHRRRLVIGELDRRREALARRLREAANVIDVELSAEETKAPQLMTIARAS
jgi:ribosome-binding protein aMBF1 (putative translation factor)